MAIGTPPTGTTMTSTDRPLRNTRQRAQLRQAVATLEGFATAQDIHDRMKHAGSRVGLATVYRNLQALVAAEELDTIRTPDGQIAYRTCTPGHHHHLICRNCGHSVEVTISSLEAEVAKLAALNGFAEVEHELEFYGTCSDCDPTDRTASP